MTEPLATFTTWSDFTRACRARRIHLGLSQLDVDHLAGLPSGYTGKIEASITNPHAKNARAIGRDSMPLILGALGLSMGVMPATGKHNGSKPSYALYGSLVAKASNGGKVRAFKMTTVRRADIARKAAMARWDLERPSRSRGAKMNRDRQRAWRERQKAKAAAAAVSGS